VTAQISVPAGFREAFDLYCERSRMTEWEKGALRDKVRADFAAWGPVISRTAAIYRFIDATWRAALRYVDFPPVRYAEGFLASHGWFPEDPEMFERCGQLLIFGICMDVAAARAAESAAIAA
jgi:hypothetical protein